MRLVQGLAVLVWAATAGAVDKLAVVRGPQLEPQAAFGPQSSTDLPPPPPQPQFALGPRDNSARQPELAKSEDPIVPSEHHPERASPSPECLLGQDFVSSISGDCSEYLECRSGRLLHKRCPQGAIFDPDLLACRITNGENCGTPSETHRLSGSLCVWQHNGQVFANPKNCSQYFLCDNGQLIQLDCPAGWTFDPVELVCELKDSSECGKKLHGDDPVCRPPGPGPLQIFPDPSDCSKYRVCDNGLLVTMECPPGLHFNPTKKVCDYPEVAGCQVKNYLSTHPYQDETGRVFAGAGDGGGVRGGAAVRGARAAAGQPPQLQHLLRVLLRHALPASLPARAHLQRGGAAVRLPRPQRPVPQQADAAPRRVPAQGGGRRRGRAGAEPGGLRVVLQVRRVGHSAPEPLPPGPALQRRAAGVRLPRERRLRFQPPAPLISSSYSNLH